MSLGRMSMNSRLSATTTFWELAEIKLFDLSNEEPQLLSRTYGRHKLQARLRCQRGC